MKKIKKILIIDDDALTAYLHKRLLESLQVAHEVEYITDPFQALQYIIQKYSNTIDEDADPELVFLDINMPGMDGFQFLEALEPLDINRSRVVIVMLTTSPYIKDRQKAAAFGDILRAYLVKPLHKESVEELLTSIQ